MDASSKYFVVKEIGKGAYGTAFIVTNKATGQRYVLKKIRLARQSIQERQGSLRELQLLSSLIHRNILRFHEAWVEAGCVVCIIVELCESGDLSTQLQLRQTQGYFPEAHLQEMLIQLVSGLAHLHRNRIIHRDIKSSNIFISADGCLKLADFGLASILESDDVVCSGVVGTPGYMAPQLLRKHVQYDGYKNDIWGLGCVLYEASALQAAFQAFNMAGLVKKVMSGAAPPLPSHYSEEWQAVIKAMLEVDEEKRPSAQDILELPWLQEARQRVAERFGSELPHGSEELFELRDLPGPVARLAEQFRQQQAEADEKLRINNERMKLLKASLASKPVAQRSSASGDRASSGSRTSAGAISRPTPTAATTKTKVATTSDAAAKRSSDVGGGGGHVKKTGMGAVEAAKKQSTLARPVSAPASPSNRRLATGTKPSWNQGISNSGKLRATATGGVSARVSTASSTSSLSGASASKTKTTANASSSYAQRQQILSDVPVASETPAS